MAQFLTDFGDSAVLLPLSLIVLLWLIFTRSWQAALWWIGALVFCDGSIALLKMYFFACPVPGGIDNPSGHTAYSLIIYGGLAWIVALDLGSLWSRVAIGAAGTLLAGAIGFSRVELGMHTRGEVAVGVAIGLVALSAFARGYLKSRRHRGYLIPLLLGAALALLFSHGQELPVESGLHALSRWLHIRELACP